MNIADRNDACRKKLSQENWLKEGHIRVILNSGVLASSQSIDDILSAVASFDEFNEETDSDDEHVFGEIDVNGVHMIWKIEYFAGDFLSPSPDKTNIDKTIHTITIMTSEEYRAAN